MGLFNQKTRKNIILTIATQVFIAVSFLMMLGVLSRTFSKTDLGLYGNYKSLIQFLYFLYTFGTDIGLARYLGFYSRNRDMQDRCFSTVITIYLALIFCSTAVLYVFGGFLTTHFLGGDRVLFYYTALALLLLGAFKIVYTYYQGVRRMVVANVLQFSALAGGNFLVTGLVLLGLVRTLRGVILLLSISMAVSLLPLVILVRQHFHWKFNFSEIIRYSFPRAPHMFLSGIILTFGIMLASYFYSYSLAGDFTVTTRLFRILGMGAYGFNMVLLPGVAAMVGSGKSGELGQSLDRYGNLIIHFGLIAMFACYVFSPVVIRLWLTDQYMSAIPILQVFSFSIPLYLYYLMFRSAIHGLDKRPIQLYFDIVSFFILLSAFFGLKHWIANPSLLIAVAMALAFLIYGVLSMVYLHQIARVPLRLKAWASHGILILGAMALSHWHMQLSVSLFIAGEITLAIVTRRKWMSLFHL